MAGTSTGLHLLAAGFNAHKQLSISDEQDLHAFTNIELPTEHAQAEKIRILFANWSSTYLLVDNHLLGLGSHNIDQPLSSETAKSLITAFGDHNALHGCLDNAGALYAINAASELLIRQGDDASPRLSHVAVAGNGIVAVTFVQAAASRLCHIIQFESIYEMFAWFHDPAKAPEGVERKHFSIHGRPKQLIANAASFLVLMEEGMVYSWGDARYKSLGRDIDTTPAGQPGLVDMLEGLNVVKIVAGGWMSGALVAGGEAYVWGTGQPGTDLTIAMLQASEPGEIAVVDISGVGPDSTKVLDLAVGDNHMALLTQQGRLFVCGDNANGQLGLADQGIGFVEDWVEVDVAGDARHVVCGPRSTFVFQNPP